MNGNSILTRAMLYLCDPNVHSGITVQDFNDAMRILYVAAKQTYDPAING